MELLPLIIVLAFILDAIIGDNIGRLHPVIIIGDAISIADDTLNKDGSPSQKKRTLGIILAITLPLIVFALTTLLLAIGYSLNAYLGFALTVALASATLSAKGLKDAAGLVLKGLNEGKIKDARASLALIVGRDTESLDEASVVKATVETTSENTSDGVIAPLFYMAIGGVPLAMAYKAVNTLDSMVGYKNDRYQDFGYGSALLDDLINYIPARLTATLIVISSMMLRLNSRSAWLILKRDGRKHPSPNAGYPEAATAGALGIELGGSSDYAGVNIEKPRIGTALRAPERYDITRATELMYLSSILMVILEVALMEIIL